MLFVILILSVLCRQIIIQPNETFMFENTVVKNKPFIFKYGHKGIADIFLYDNMGNLVAHENRGRNGTFFTEALEDGRFKIVIKNNDRRQQLIFSYKCPDPKEEVLGHLGYVEGQDLISHLTKLLNKFIKHQQVQIEKTRENYTLVEKGRKLAKVIMIVEVLVTLICVFYLHRDFVSMFEKRQSL